MNILGLVFSLLFLLGLGFHSMWNKYLGASRIHSAYIGHQRAHRKILEKYESQIYAEVRSKPKEKRNLAKNTKGEEPRSSKEKAKEFPEINASCARINLYPLVADGREAHPFLYELVAKTLRTFYSKQLFGKEKKMEYRLLDSILHAAQKEKTPVLEKLHLKEQILYYKLLKGTKKWDITAQQGYPSLLDYFSLDQTEKKICLYHAHQNLLSILFGEKGGKIVYNELNKKDTPPITKEYLEHLCSEAHLVQPDAALFELIQFGHPHHEKLQLTFVSTDEKSQVFLRVSIPPQNQPTAHSGS
jgi:hypothetical protein